MGKLRIGRGDFTMLKYIENLSAADLEKVVGFHKGRLDSGFSIIALDDDEIMRPEDFELKASTRWSAGDMAIEGGDNIRDVLLSRGQDPEKLKEKVSDFFLRRGGNTPAKVLPNRRHDAQCFYPDAEALAPGVRSGVPQFSLSEACGGKNFIVVREG